MNLSRTKIRVLLISSKCYHYRHFKRFGALVPQLYIFFSFFHFLIFLIYTSVYAPSNILSHQSMEKPFFFLGKIFHFYNLKFVNKLGRKIFFIIQGLLWHFTLYKYRLMENKSITRLIDCSCWENIGKGKSRKRNTSFPDRVYNVSFYLFDFGYK